MVFSAWFKFGEVIKGSTLGMLKTKQNGGGTYVVYISFF